jgi:hypothetical protein
MNVMRQIGLRLRCHKGRRKGQAILESLLVLLVLLAAFFFFYDFSYATVSQIHLNHATARVARADTVGFNAFQRQKSLNVGMIPVSGRRLAPEPERGRLMPWQELAYVRTYLGSETYADSKGILDYERWASLGHTTRHALDQCEVSTSFSIPTLMPWRFAQFLGLGDEGPWATSSQKIRSRWVIEDHASLYLIR